MITDEMVEKAARAIIEVLYPQRLPSWTDYKLRIDGEPYRAEARAALAAVLPDILETILREVKKEAENYDLTYHQVEAAIRALAVTQDGKK